MVIAWSHESVCRAIPQLPASAAELLADEDHSICFPPIANFYEFAAEDKLTFLPKARRMWYDEENVRMRRF